MVREWKTCRLRQLLFAYSHQSVEITQFVNATRQKRWIRNRHSNQAEVGTAYKIHARFRHSEKLYNIIWIVTQTKHLKKLLGPFLFYIAPTHTQIASYFFVFFKFLFFRSEHYRRILMLQLGRHYIRKKEWQKFRRRNQTILDGMQ